MYSVSEVVARVLAPRIDTYFGIMGNGNAWFIDALEQLGHEMIPVRHEVATVASADAFHRVTDKIAVATTTYGPGFTNTITALVESAKGRVPLVLVTGSAPQHSPRPWDIDQASLAASFGVHTFTATPADAAQQTFAALAHASAHRTPVVLEIPYDLGAQECIDKRLQTLLDTSVPMAQPEVIVPGAEEIGSIASLLVDAQRPLLLAGRGAKSAAADVIRLADFLEADVATSAPDQGLFNGTGKFRDLGICGGFASKAAAAEIGQADVVLVIGAGLNPFTLAFGQAFHPAATVIQIDVAEQATCARVDRFLRGSAHATVPALLSALQAKDFTAAGRPSPCSEVKDHEKGDALAPDGRLDPRSLMHAINDIIPSQRLVVTDGGHFIGWANTHLDVPAADNMVLLGTTTQSIGLGFSSAVGVAAAAGEEKMTVLVTGDGGGLMALADAESFVRQAHRGVIVVVNDAAYGAEIHQYATKGVSAAPMLIPEVNFARLLSALGARATVIHTLEDLADFRAWVDSQETGTYVLDCRVSREIIAPFMQELMAR